ncbi:MULTISPECIES: 16S rRNA (guanine(527)-N(7))-methyltransferase RsmG [Helicobacter]|nr:MULTISPECIES: 16S rRNA (guanine(527)-N(7))-methyltransferase RsmG [Helicobacter]MDA3967007.1 16S rRNA (guanine(527)-N(7))-methyltransferase RsmG [Helicobacter sp. WB40]
MNMEKYIQILQKWNKIHSLSGANSKERIEKNIQYSLYPLTLDSLKIKDKTCILDIGSGNGFPAVPLGISLNITTILCEPNVKKAAFLQNLKAELELDNFYIFRKKVEELSLSEIVAQTNKEPDLITSRATFEVKELLNKCIHLLNRDSLLLLFKGSSVQDELSKIKLKYEIFNNGLLNYIAIKGAECSGL